MLTSRTKLIMFLFLGVLLCIFGCIGMTEVAQKGSEGQAPVRGMTIMIDVSQREELFDQLQDFAEKHAFTFHLDFYDPNKRIFLISMYRKDLKISAVDVPDAPTNIDLDIYERNPSSPTQKETINVLYNDLKSSVSEIPNVTIIEER